ncbi:hypothetical protein SALBM135S_06080 [Streptomyces alboniger]
MSVPDLNVGPYSMVTAPRSLFEESSSPGAPMTRSAWPSPFRSPQAVAEPHSSPASETPGTPVLVCVREIFEPPTGPSEPPGRTVTRPRPLDAFGVAAIRSVTPSPL